MYLPPLFVWEPGGEEALTKLPGHLQEGIRNYLEHGLPVGHFLQAVICNDLVKAVGYADHISSLEIKEVVSFFVNYAPGPSWGSEEKMQAWVKERGEEAFERNVEAVRGFGKKPGDGGINIFINNTQRAFNRMGVSVRDASKALEELSRAGTTKTR